MSVSTPGIVACLDLSVPLKGSKLPGSESISPDHDVPRPQCLFWEAGHTLRADEWSGVSEFSSPSRPSRRAESNSPRSFPRIGAPRRSTRKCMFTHCTRNALYGSLVPPQCALQNSKRTSMASWCRTLCTSVAALKQSETLMPRLWGPPLTGHQGRQQKHYSQSQDRDLSY